MRRHPSLINGICVLSVVVSTSALRGSEGHDLLKKSQAALSKVKEVSYKGAFSGKGWVGPLVPTANGAIVMGQPSEWDEPRFRAQAKVTPRGSTDEHEVTVGCNGDEYFIVNNETKKVHVDMDAAVMGSGARDVQRLIFDALLSKEPFGEKLSEKKIELRASESVGGVDCQIVFIEGAGAPGDPMIEWLIGKKDAIPRGIRRIYNNREDPENGEKGITQLLITDLKVNPKLGKNPFDATIPAGYTRTDEFLP